MNKNAIGLHIFHWIFFGGQIATVRDDAVYIHYNPFASTRCVQIATKTRGYSREAIPLCPHMLCADCNNPKGEKT